MDFFQESEVAKEVEVEIGKNRKVIQQLDKDGHLIRELWLGVVEPEPEPDPREEYQSFLVDAQGNPLADNQAHLATHRVFRRYYDGKLVSENVYPLADRV